MRDKVSVLIPTRNRPLILAKCLNSLRSQKTCINQVVVVDNGLEKTAEKIVSGFGKDFEIDYFREEKQGEAFARNKALKLAKGEILVFIDDDCVADKNWLKNIIIHFKKYPDCDGLLGKTENYLKNNPYANVCQVYYLRWLLENFKKINQIQILKPNNNFFDTKNFAFEKKLIKNFSFDPDVLFHGVDVDNVAGNVLRKKGKFYYHPGITVYHRHWSSFRELMIKNFFQGIANQLILEKKGVNPRELAFKYDFRDFWENLNKEIKDLNFSKKIIFWLLLFIYPIPYKIGRLFYKIKKSI